jgi:glutamate synthase (NADPH/NADH) small chain
VGKVTGFLDFNRDPPERRSAAERINDFKELYQKWPEAEVREQGARCMDCALPSAIRAALWAI